MQPTTTESSVKPKKPKMGRPRIPEEQKRVSFTASISPQANVLIENWADSRRDLKRHRRMGVTIDDLVRHAIRTNFNPNT